MDNCFENSLSQANSIACEVIRGNILETLNDFYVVLNEHNGSINFFRELGTNKKMFNVKINSYYTSFSKSCYIPDTFEEFILKLQQIANAFKNGASWT